MTDFVVTITNPDQLDGITWAREQYNAALPPPPEDGITTVEIPQPPPLETDQEYVQHVMEHAAMSYADQKLRKEYQDHYENAVTARRPEAKVER